MASTARLSSAALILDQGKAHHRAGRLDEAERCYRSVLAKKPNVPDALHLLGVLVGVKGDYEQSAALLERAARLQPVAADVHANLGISLAAAGRATAAVESLKRAVAINPHHVVAQHHLGTVLRDLGRREEALAAYRAALAAKPDLAEVFSNLGLIWTWREGDELSRALLALAGRSDRLPPDSRVHLFYALGKYYDDIGDPDAAFSHWLKGAALKRRNARTVAAGIEATFMQIAAAFPPGPWARRRDYGDASELPVFVLGMPRSGTSLVEQILASHPEIHAGGELDLLRRSLLGLHIDPRVLLAGAPGEEQLAAELRRRGRAYVDDLARLAPNARRITDKQPGNYQYIGPIHLVLPRSRIILCRRDLRDVAVSCFQTLFRHGHDWTYDLSELGRVAVAFARLMDHWRAVLPDRFLEVDYETIVAEPETEARRIVGHCGLEWNAACLDFRNTERAVRTASAGQVRQPIHARSVGRWRRYERHLGPLLEALAPLGLD